MDPAQLKAQYDQTQYLSDQHTTIGRDLLKGFDQNAIDLLKSQSAQTNEIKDSAERANFAAEWRQNNGFARINENVVEKAGDVKETIYKGNENVTAWINKNGADNLAATERIGGQIDSDLYRVAGQLDNSIYRSFGDFRKEVSDGNSLALQTMHQIHSAGQQERATYQNEMIGFVKTAGDQNWSNFGKIGQQLSHIEVEALKNKADLSKQSAFQFSELKSSIASSEASIKDLLRAQESDRLRDALRATENKSLYFELRHRHHHRHH